MNGSLKDLASTSPGGCPDGVTSPSDTEVSSQVSMIAILAVVSALGNVILMWTIAKSSKLHSISNVLTLNLAASDLMVSTLILPTWAVITWHQKLVFGQPVCVGIGVVMMTSLLESMATLAGIGVDRFLNICQPLRYVSLVSGKRATTFVVVTWLWSLLLAFLPVMHVGRYDFRPGCVPICRVDYIASVPYAAGVVATGVVPHCLVMCFCYCAIFRTARNQARQIAAVHPVVPPFVSSSNAGPQLFNSWALPTDAKTRTARWVNEVNCVVEPYFRNRAGSSIDTSAAVVTARDMHVTSASAPISPVTRTAPANKRMTLVATADLWRKATRTVKRNVSQTRAIRTVLTIIGAYAVCWLPYIVLIVHVIVDRRNASYGIEFAATFMAFSNSLANPLICVIVNRELRKALVLAVSTRKQTMLRAAVAAFVESGQRRVDSIQYPSRRSTSDLTSEASDVLMVRSVYQKFVLSQQNGDRESGYGDTTF
ncbi:hypothetical protein LSH36_555g01006 [Paralvinella palmiformis]|uniref:G-protein coupled receptors family 1 profile domain-containing protein n=1 Tax=Paralvinella palmiformis TaxID=53620 RepID=A0AAD9J724_9ANNE|nr:hypothetical protein LSH36_555g01006 [Paralvinella palmiformis]